MIKYNKVYFGILMVTLSILMLGLVSAATLGNYGLNQCVHLKQTCGNCTYVNITSITATTNDGASVKVSGLVPMTKQGTEYNYTFCGTGYVGEYTYITTGDPNGVVDTESVTFNVGGSNSIILIVIIFALIYLIGFFGFFGKNVWVSILGGLAMLALGIFVLRNGIDIYRSFITNVVGLVTIALGAIFSLTAGVELIQENL